MAGWAAAAMGDCGEDTVVITGANSGIGFAATRAFAERGATVVMACRDADRGERAAASLRGDVEGSLHVASCDLADLESIATFAEEVRDSYASIDVLCNNAGIMAVPAGETADGFERQIGVNHLGHFALTGQLIEHLTPGSGRVVTQSSGLHDGAEGHFDTLRPGETYDRWDAYRRSKLANVLFAYELQRRIDASDRAIRSIACHPGYADTNLQSRMADAMRIPFAGWIVGIANRVFAQSADRGALPMLYAATADVSGGSYVGPDGFGGMRGAPAIQSSSDRSYDADLASELWELSAHATGCSYPLPA